MQPAYMRSTIIDAVPICLETIARNDGPALRGANRCGLRGFDGVTLPVYVLEFDPELFYPDAYAATGIAYPTSVARSAQKRQAEFFFGRLAARLALSALAAPGQTIPTVSIGASREPLWPPDVVGSISHSHRFAAAAAERRGRRHGVGIDIEHIVTNDARDALLATVVNEQEISYLSSLVGEEWPLEVLLTVVFSAKESLFKGAFGAVGHYFDFSAAKVVMLDLECGHVRFALTETLCSQFVHAQHCDVTFGFIRADAVLTHFTW